MTNTFCLAGLRARRKPLDTISRVCVDFFVNLKHTPSVRVPPYDSLWHNKRFSQSVQKCSDLVEIKTEMGSVTNCGRLSGDNGWRSFWMVEILNGPKNIWWISDRKYWNLKYGLRTELACFCLPLGACTSGVEWSHFDFDGNMLTFPPYKISDEKQ